MPDVDSRKLTVVVCDTSPIRFLAWLGRLQLLQKLFGVVLIPPTVVHELASARKVNSRVMISDFPFFQVESPRDQQEVDVLCQLIDRRETEALILAKERQALLIVDDAAARTEACRNEI